MNDRELLELAAKAIRLNVRWYDGECLIVADKCNGYAGKWNPLTDDGDALRLAVKLRFGVDPWGAGACAVVFRPNDMGQIHEPHYGDDPERATRRAIVRAAAEIGKGME
jgi:hypothetical protein